MSKWIPMICAGAGLSIILLKQLFKKKETDPMKLKMDIINALDDDTLERINGESILINSEDEVMHDLGKSLAVAIKKKNKEDTKCSTPPKVFLQKFHPTEILNEQEHGNSEESMVSVITIQNAQQKDRVFHSLLANYIKVIN